MLRHLRTLSLLTLLLIASGAMGQFALGFRLGYSNVLHGETTTDTYGEAFTLKNDDSHGFNLGLMMRAGSKVFVQLEGYYQFNKIPFFSADTSTFFNERYSTVEVPVMLGYKVIDREKFNWRFMVGPRFRFSVGSSTTLDSVLYEVVSNKWQLGLSVGTGLDIGPVTLDFKYALTSNIFNTSLRYTDMTPVELKRTLLNGFEATIGYKMVDIRRRKSVGGSRRMKRGTE